MSNCHEEDCIIRHKKQDEMAEDLKEVKQALVGDAINQKNSLVSKVNILIDDMTDRKQMGYLAVSLFSILIITTIFSAGVMSNRIDNIEKQVAKNTQNIELMIGQK